MFANIMYFSYIMPNFMVNKSGFDALGNVKNSSVDFFV